VVVAQWSEYWQYMPEAQSFIFGNCQLSLLHLVTARDNFPDTKCSELTGIASGLHRSLTCETPSCSSLSTQECLWK